MATNLEFRIAKKHAEKNKFDAPISHIHSLNPVWSYARHLPDDWDQNKIQRRTDVASRLRDNLLETLDIPAEMKTYLKRLVSDGPGVEGLLHISAINDEPEKKMDLSPLKDDIRASGFVYGPKPLFAAFEMIKRLAIEHPQYPFFGKWGGYDDTLEGKRIVFYCDGLDDALILSERLNSISKRDGVKLAIAPNYGITTYTRFVDIDKAFESKVRNAVEFLDVLQGLQGYPHFIHDLFTQ
jgi:hypothetical protein